MFRIYKLSIEVSGPIKRTRNNVVESLLGLPINAVGYLWVFWGVILETMEISDTPTVSASPSGSGIWSQNESLQGLTKKGGDRIRNA